MGAIRKFEFPDTGKVLTAIEYGGQTVFTPDDVADLIGHHSSKKVAALVRKHGQPGKHYITLTGSEASAFASAVLPGGSANKTRSYCLLTEIGLYKALLHAETPLCHRVQEWITDEVLPSIRKTGGYGKQAPGLSEEEIIALVARTVAAMNRSAPTPTIELQVQQADRRLRAGDIATLFGVKQGQVQKAVNAIRRERSDFGVQGPQVGRYAGPGEMTTWYDPKEISSIREVLGGTSEDSVFTHFGHTLTVVPGGKR